MYTLAHLLGGLGLSSAHGEPCPEPVERIVEPSVVSDAGGRRKIPTASPVAHRLLGVWGVSEPAALLASGSQELLVAREKTARATIAVTRMNFSSPQKPPSHGRQS